MLKFQTAKMRKSMLAKWERLLPLLTLILVFTLSGIAQEKTSNVSGIVKSESGMAISNVSVIAKNSSTNLASGTQTDSNGMFTFLKLPVNGRYSFIFSSIGYETQTLSGYTLKDDATTSIIIKLKDSSTLLKDVVVIGYGTARRSQISSSISTVKMETVDQGSGYNPLKMLQGRATGVNVISPSGQPGARPIIQIRGVSSISGSSSPLFVIDGIPNENYPNLNPNDIESIEVLKDASASAIYGSRANGGVVIITTKTGKSGKSKVEFDARVGWGTVLKDIEMANSEEYARVMKAAVDNFNTQRGTALAYYQPAPNEIQETNWVKEISREKAKTSTYNVSISGGNDKTVFYNSFGYFNQEGALQRSSFEQFSYRLNLSHRLNSIFKLNTNLSVTYAKNNLLEEENSGLKVLRTAREEQPWYNPYLPNGDYKVNGTYIIRHNPVMLVNEETWWRKRYEGLASISMDVTPFKGFKYTPAVRLYGILDDERKTLTEKMVARSLSAGWGAVAQDRDLGSRYVIENMFNYNNKAGKLAYNITAGHSFEEYAYEGFGAYSDNYANGAFPSSGFEVINAGPNIFPSGGIGYNAYALESFIGRAGFTYNDKYVLNASVRADGASKFSEDKRYGTFPTVSAAWLASKEDFLKDINFISDLKVRASYGITGSIQGVSNFAALSLVSAGGNAYNGQGGFAVSQDGQDITWEKSKQVNLGLDMTLLRGALGISADFFKQRTEDLLYNRPIQATSGYTTIPGNVGTLENSGMEFSANGKMTFGAFKWDLNANISLIDNKIVSILDNTPSLIVPSSGSNLYGGQMHALINGRPVSAWYMWDAVGIYQNDADVPAALAAKGVRAGDVIYRDLNKDGDITDADRDYVGKAVPDFYGGFTSNLAWKGFELNIFGQYSSGGKIMASWRGVNGVEGTDHLGNAFANVRIDNNVTTEQFFNIRKDVAYGYWSGPGTSNTTPRPVRRGVFTGYGTQGYNFLTSTRFLEDASFFRIKTLTLAYNIPQNVLSRAKISELRFFVSADNLLLRTKYSGYDPEQSLEERPGHPNYGVDFGLQPSLRTILVGLNMKL
jgi:TonB-linked SusC/RagA family outer membrane protein